MGEGTNFCATVWPGDDAAPAIVSVLAAAREFARREAVDTAVAARLAIVLEELVANAVRHGMGDGECRIEGRLAATDGGVQLELTDTGRPFDPFEERPFTGPDRETGGGVGLELVRRWAHEPAYCREGSRNRVRLTLR
jgi:anti-sigma regulatory factor (Ser/Thr protein kinase)